MHSLVWLVVGFSFCEFKWDELELQRVKSLVRSPSYLHKVLLKNIPAKKLSRIYNEGNFTEKSITLKNRSILVYQLLLLLQLSRNKSYLRKELLVELCSEFLTPDY